MFFNLLNACLDCAILCLISSSHLPSPAIIVPRYLNLSEFKTRLTNVNFTCRSQTAFGKDHSVSFLHVECQLYIFAFCFYDVE